MRTPPPERESETMEWTGRTEDPEIQELRRMLAQQQQVIQQLQFSQNQRPQNPGMAVLSEGTLGNYLHFSIRDALEAVPIYDGENIPFVYFVEGCEEALSMITPSQELNLVRAVRNKLKSDAHRSILGKTFNNMQELVEFLRTKYGSRETVYEAQGRLAYLCQKKDERVVAYANRVRELGKRILDAQKRETGQISAEFRNSIDKHLKNSFLRGLNKEIIISREGSFDEIESRAIEAEKEFETINMIRRVVLAENAPTENKSSVRRIEARPVICQYCHKKGHTADKCWQLNKPQGNGDRSQSKSGFSQSNNRNNNGNNNGNSSNNNNYKQPSSTIQNSNPIIQNSTNNQNVTMTCRYCKKLGHTLEECRKRMYNNNLRRNSQAQGNEQIPARTGATPGNITSRPARVISEEPESVTEQ